MLEIVNAWFSMKDTLQKFFTKNGYSFLSISDKNNESTFIAVPSRTKIAAGFKHISDVTVVTEEVFEQFINRRQSWFNLKNSGETTPSGAVKYYLCCKDDIIFTVLVVPLVGKTIGNHNYSQNEDKGLVLLERLIKENVGERIQVRLRTFSDVSEGNAYLELRYKDNFAIVQYSNIFDKPKFGIAKQQPDSVLLDLKPDYECSNASSALLRIQKLFGLKA